MALLNYTSLLSNLENWVKKDLEIYFTGDKHLLTHGVDFLADYTNGLRGLVPSYDTTKTLGILSSDGWKVLDLQITTSSSSIPTSQAVIEYLSGAINASTNMIFKGVISFDPENDTYTTTSTDTNSSNSFPSSCRIGDTYRIGYAYTYGGLWCEPGDLLVCIKDGEVGETINTSEYWTVVQTNINGSLVSITVNDTELKLYGSGSNIKFYAPSTVGTNGLFLGYSDTGFTWYSLPIASASLAGLVKIGLNITVSEGTISLTLSDIINALGYTPGSNEIKTFTYNLSYANDVLKLIQIDNDDSTDVSTITFPTVSSTNNGFAPKFIETNESLIGSDFYILSSKAGTGVPSWYRLPATAFLDTWRDILVGNISIGSKTLRFMPTGTIYVKTSDADATTDEFDVSFDIAWYEITVDDSGTVTGTYVSNNV